MPGTTSSFIVHGLLMATGSMDLGLESKLFYQARDHEHAPLNWVCSTDSGGIQVRFLSQDGMCV